MFSADITVHQVLMYDIIVPVFYLGHFFLHHLLSLLPSSPPTPSLPTSLRSKREKGSGLPHHSWGDEVVLLVDGQRFPVHPRLPNNGLETNDGAGQQFEKYLQEDLLPAMVQYARVSGDMFSSPLFGNMKHNGQCTDPHLFSMHECGVPRDGPYVLVPCNSLPRIVSKHEAC